MCLKIRCDGESEKFCKIFWKLNKALVVSIFLIKFFTRMDCIFVDE